MYSEEGPIRLDCSGFISSRILIFGSMKWPYPKEVFQFECPLMSYRDIKLRQITVQFVT